jgi:hypothetical protein
MINAERRPNLPLCTVPGHPVKVLIAAAPAQPPLLQAPLEAEAFAAYFWAVPTKT